MLGGSGTSSPLTTKGDRWGYSTTNARIAVGADGQILTADSTQTLGVKWAAGASANITPDTHPSSPTAWDDEFEFGSTLDTTGARRSGANAWSWLNQSTATASVGQGALTVTAPALSGDNWRIVMQTVPASGAWKFRAKLGSTAAISAQNFENSGLILYNSGNGKLVTFGPAYNSGGSQAAIYAYRFPSVSGSGTNVFAGAPSNVNFALPMYLEVDWDGSANLTFWYSMNGYDGMMQKLYSETLASYLGALTHIGLGVESNNASQAAVLYCDWFRRTA